MKSKHTESETESKANLIKWLFFTKINMCVISFGKRARGLVRSSCLVKYFGLSPKLLPEKLSASKRENKNRREREGGQESVRDSEVSA